MSNLISRVGLPVGLWGSPVDIIKASRGKTRTDFPKAAPVPQAAQVRVDFPKAAGIPLTATPMDRMIAHAQSLGHYNEF